MWVGLFRCTAKLGLVGAATALSLAASPAHAFQARFQVGDRVECSNYSDTGPWDPGTVIDYTQEDRQRDPRGIASGRFYRVNLDKYPAFLNPTTCVVPYIRPGAAAANNPRANGSASGQRGGAGQMGNRPSPPPPRLAPPAGGNRQAQNQPPRNAPAPPAAGPPGAGGPAPRDLRGTAWKIESRGSIGVQVFLFCNSGRWEIVGSQLFNGGVSPVGTYRQAGSRVTTRNQDDGMVTNWSLSWGGGDRMDMNDGRVTLRTRYNGRTTC
jgi:hypothetical protein